MQQRVPEDSQEDLQFSLVIESNCNTAELPKVLKFGELRMNTTNGEVTRAGRQIELTTTEYNLLKLFMRHPRQILNRQTILHQVWGHDFLGETNIIEVYVRYLREKLEDVPGSPRLLLTVCGMGYVLKD